MKTNGHYVPQPLKLLEDETLTPTAKQVWQGFASFAFGDKDEVYPSNDQVAELLKINVATVKRSKRKLVARGWMELVERKYNRPSVYRLHTERKRTDALPAEEKAHEDRESARESAPETERKRTSVPLIKESNHSKTKEPKHLNVVSSNEIKEASHAREARDDSEEEIREKLRALGNRTNVQGEDPPWNEDKMFPGPEDPERKAPAALSP
jgi:DNA-binding transcriptional MocR family regulator